MTNAERWRGRLLTAEALAGLATARLLVRHVRFERWRASLGEPCSQPPPPVDDRLDANLVARRLARAVERAAGRLPGGARCLPQAMALQWMLRRRKLGGAIVLGVLPGAQRGSLEDLHAWVLRRGEVLLGAGEDGHAPVLTLVCPELP